MMQEKRRKLIATKANEKIKYGSIYGAKTDAKEKRRLERYRCMVSESYTVSHCWYLSFPPLPLLLLLFLPALIPSYHLFSSLHLHPSSPFIFPSFTWIPSIHFFPFDLFLFFALFFSDPELSLLLLIISLSFLFLILSLSLPLLSLLLLNISLSFLFLILSLYLLSLPHPEPSSATTSEAVGKAFFSSSSTKGGLRFPKAQLTNLPPSPNASPSSAARRRNVQQLQQQQQLELLQQQQQLHWNLWRRCS